jgi:glutaredoxin
MLIHIEQKRKTIQSIDRAMSQKHLIMYSRTWGCPFITTAKQVLSDYQVPYTEIFIDQDPLAKERVIAWTGFQSVPTLVVAEMGQVTPYEPPSYLPFGETPRGVDRGTMLTEAGHEQLLGWLKRHGFISAEAATS